MEYSHIFFDWHGVLSNSRFWHHIPENDLIEAALFGSLHLALKEWLEGKRDVYSFISLLSKNTNLQESYLLETLKESCERFELCAPDIPSLISKLKKAGIVCVIATDNFDVFDMWIVPALKLNVIFDDILNSFNIKHVKPDIDENGYSPFFGRYFEENNVKKSLLIDDNDYSKVVKALGMDFKLINSSEEFVEFVEKLAVT